MTPYRLQCICFVISVENKKVLLRDRKRHTGHGVVCPPRGYVPPSYPEVVPRPVPEVPPILYQERLLPVLSGGPVLSGDYNQAIGLTGVPPATDLTWWYR